MKYAYLHGFGSGPSSLKGRELRDRLAPRGIELELPDLNRPNFGTLTFTHALQAIDEMVARAPEATWRFIGSSMGGYLAARWAQLNPDRVERLFLLCPGFGLSARWPDLLGPQAWEEWQETGRLGFEDANGEVVDVHWAFVEDARRHPDRPVVACPVRILHGVEDEVVPVESSQTYADAHEHVELVEVDDDHSLSGSIARIEAEVLDFFSLG